MTSAGVFTGDICAYAISIKPSCAEAVLKGLGCTIGTQLTLVLLKPDISCFTKFWIHVLLQFSLSVKAVTLIFISGRDLAISSTHEGKTGNINGKTENCNCLLRVKLISINWENIVYEDRKCNLCDKNDLGDEFHYLLICPYFQNERKDLLKRYYYLRPNTIKFQELLNCKNKQVLLNLSKFMKLIMSKFV